MKGEPVKYTYSTSLKWTNEKKGILKSNDKPDIEVSCPPEFGGNPRIWSPEDLFLASVEICIMTTLLHLSDKSRIDLVSYSSNAEGTVQLVGSSMEFSTISISIDVQVNSEKDKERIEKLMDKLHRICLVSNSIKSKLNLDYKINVK